MAKGFLALYNATERVDVGDEFWVDVRVCISKADHDLAQKRLMQNKLTVHGGRSDMSGDLDIPGYEEELVVRSIADWNLTDDSEPAQPLPLVPIDALRKSVQRLPHTAFKLIFDRVNELNAPREKEDAASFRDSDS